MITVHHLNNSRSQRIVWLMEELALDYILVKHQRDPQTFMAPPSLKAIHPLGKAPTIEDRGIAISESGAIMEYIVNAYGQGQLAPEKNSVDHMHYLEWMHYVEGSAIAPLMFQLLAKIANCDHEGLSMIINYIKAANLTFVESQLADKEFIVGKTFTAADIQLTFLLEMIDAAGEISAYPNANAYLLRMQQRSAYKKAIEKGGPYSLKDFG